MKNPVSIYMADGCIVFAWRKGGSRMSLEMRIFICSKCGKTFHKAVGGVVMTPGAMELMVNPVCDDCKAKAAAKTIGSILDIFK